MASFDSFEEINPQAAHGSFVEVEDDMSYSNFSSYSNVATAPEDEDDGVAAPLSSQDVFGFGSSMDSSPFGPIHENGHGNGYGAVSDGPILPPPSDMEPEEGFALREWRRHNTIYLEEKEKKEKEMRVQIIEEGVQYLQGFYEKRHLNVETCKTNNREREKLFLTNQDKFHKEASKHYWKAIADLIPNEVPNIEKKRGKKDQEKKPSITVVQGPKPGKPTELSRMRHVLLKLKHTPPPHMVAPPQPPAKDAKVTKDAKDGKDVKDPALEPAAVKVAISNGSSNVAKQDARTAADEPSELAPISSD